MKTFVNKWQRKSYIRITSLFLLFVFIFISSVGFSSYLFCFEANGSVNIEYGSIDWKGNSAFCEVASQPSNEYLNSSYNDCVDIPISSYTLDSFKLTDKKSLNAPPLHFVLSLSNVLNEKLALGINKPSHQYSPILGPVLASLRTIVLLN